MTVDVVAPLPALSGSTQPATSMGRQIEYQLWWLRNNNDADGVVLLDAISRRI